jgi:hypothetical protein
VVEERLIDGGALISSSTSENGVKNQIRSVTTVTTTTVVNSVQSKCTSLITLVCNTLYIHSLSLLKDTNGSASSTSTSTASASSSTAASDATAVLAPLAEEEMEAIDSGGGAPRESAL